jgi:WD40 repeat protein
MGSPQSYRVHKFKGHSKSVLTLALSTDGLLASGSIDDTARLWEFPSGKLLRTFDQFTKEVNTVEFTPHDTLLMASTDGSVKTWDLKGGADVRTLISSDEHEQGEYGPFVRPIVLSPSGKLLAMSFNRTVELRDTALGEKLAVVQGRLRTTSALAFSPDNTRLAAANGLEPRVEIWELPTEQRPDLSPDIAEYKARRTRVRTTVFAPKGKILASAPWKTIDLWDPTTGTVIRTSDEFEQGINCLTFSPNSEAIGIRLREVYENLGPYWWERC